MCSRGSSHCTAATPHLHLNADDTAAILAAIKAASARAAALLASECGKTGCKVGNWAIAQLQMHKGVAGRGGGLPS